MKLPKRSALVLLLLVPALPLAAQVQAPPMMPADAKAEIVVEVPPFDPFVLRATLPLPRFQPSAGNRKLRLVDSDGTFLADTQIETVMRYANATGVGTHSDVIEIAALVHRRANWQTGERRGFLVVAANDPPVTVPANPTHLDLATGPVDVPLSIQALVANPASILIRAIDPLGKEYLARPFLTPNVKVEKYGPALTVLRTFDTLRPVVAPAPGEYTHLFGITCYAQTVSGSPTLRLDVRVSNGYDNSDATTSDDDPLGTVYFKRIDLLVVDDANLWTMMADFNDPFVYLPGGTVGSASVGGVPYRVFPLVKPNRVINGVQDMHFMDCKMHFVRRVGIGAAADQVRLRQELDLQGLGFAIEGTNGIGERYWSWSNEETARFYAQKEVVPTLDYGYTSPNSGCAGLTGLAALRCTLESRFAIVRDALANNTPIPWPQYGSDAALGWARPYDRNDGGAVDGTSIVFVEGDRVLAAASREGARALTLYHRMSNDRQPEWIFDATGNPTRQEKWLTPTTPAACPDCPVDPNNPGVAHYASFSFVNYWPPSSPDDVFCRGPFNWIQNQYVAANGLQPDYETNPNPLLNLRAHTAHDNEHLTRYARFPLALTWVCNDPLAKDDVKMLTELFRMTFTEFRGQNYTPGEALFWYAHTYPSWAYSIGRAEGWGLQVAGAGFALADDATRLRLRIWLDRVIDAADRSIGNVVDPCYTDSSGTPYQYGILSARNDSTACAQFYSPPQPVPCWRGRQLWEEMILQAGLRSVLLSAYSSSETKYSLLSAVLVKSYLGLLSPTAWNEAVNAIWDKNPVTPDLPLGSAPFVNNDPLFCAPGPGSTPYVAPYEPYGLTSSSHYFMASMADAYHLTGDSLFIERPLQHLGGTCGGNCEASLRAALEASTTITPTSSGNVNYDSWPQRGMLLGRVQQP